LKIEFSDYQKDLTLENLKMRSDNNFSMVANSKRF